MSYREAAEDRSRLVVAVNGYVAALDVATGVEVWRNMLPAGGSGVVEVWVEGDHVYVVPESGESLIALDYTSGEELWRASTRGVGRASLLLDGPRVLIARQGYVTCFDRRGQKLWDNALKGFGHGPTALALPGVARQADADRKS